MAAPTPTTRTDTSGDYGVVVFEAEWTAGAADNFSDQIVLDISALDGAPTQVQVLKAYMTCSPGLAATLEYEHTTDQIISSVPLGAMITVIDFTEFYYGKGRRGWTDAGTGTTGDIVVTTRSAADGDEMLIVLEFYKGSLR